MVEVKVERSEIIFRVVYVGSRTATKFANLRGLHDQIRKRGDDVADLSVFFAGGDRVLSFRHYPSVDPIYGLKVGIEVLTVPGEALSPSNEELLLAAADAIVYLDDRSGDTPETKDLDALLSVLEVLGQDPRKMSFVIQCYQETSEERAGLYRGVGSQDWNPKVRRIPATPTGALELLDELESDVLETYRGYEEELAKAGLNSHLKIRDRIYEKIPAARPTQGSPDSQGTGEKGTRLARRARPSAEPSLRAKRPWTAIIIGLAVVLAILAAALVQSL
ncbi:MAG: hypothetical protein V3W41_18480 [Planctomycetota bacterium]